MRVNLKNSCAGAIALLAAATFSIDVLAQSHGRCDAEARRYANRATPTGENVAGGAVAGAVGGAIIGGILGGGRGAARGAAIGGGAGAVGGAGRSSVQWHNAYDYAYDRCMDGY